MNAKTNDLQTLADQPELETSVNTDIAEYNGNLTSHSAGSLSPLVMMLANGHLNPEHIETAMLLQEKHDAYIARKAFSAAMSRFRSLAPVLKKDKTVSFSTAKGKTEYDHTTLGYMMSVINPILGHCELNLSWHPRQDGQTVYVTTKLSHVLGHSESIELFGTADTSGTKNSIQAMKSTVTYLQRAGAQSILGLSSGDDDNDGYLPEQPQVIEYITEKQESQLVDLMDLAAEKLGDDFAKRFMAHYKNQFSESDTPFGLRVPLNRFEGVKKAIQTKLDEDHVKKAVDKQDAPL